MSHFQGTHGALLVVHRCLLVTFHVGVSSFDRYVVRFPKLQLNKCILLFPSYFHILQLLFSALASFIFLLQPPTVVAGIKMQVRFAGRVARLSSRRFSSPFHSSRSISTVTASKSGLTNHHWAPRLSSFVNHSMVPEPTATFSRLSLATNQTSTKLASTSGSRTVAGDLTGLLGTKMISISVLCGCYYSKLSSLERVCVCVCVCVSFASLENKFCSRNNAESIMYLLGSYY